jgi:hypothetical protein
MQDRKERGNHHLPHLSNKDDDVELAAVVAALAKMQVAEFTI